MRLNVHHITHYRFEQPAIYALQQLRKTPHDTPGQQVLSWNTTVIGGRKELRFHDFHGNIVELLRFDGDTDEIRVISEGEVETKDVAGVTGAHRAPIPLWYFQRPTALTKAGAGVRAMAKEIANANNLAQFHALSELVRERVKYQKDISHTSWDAEQVLTDGVGVCQDQAHVFIAVARELGAPARYVSGYLRLDSTEEQEAMHAWAEVWIDELGWVGFDISNAVCPDERYVLVATGADYAEAAPVRGCQIGGSGETLTVEIAVSHQQ